MKDFHHSGRPPVCPDRGAPDCDDQLPVISRVGRGISGDGYKVEVDDPDSTCETHLHGYVVDGATGEVRSDWVSENVNGGELSYQYVLRPYTLPQTFTITFVYRRPGRPEWSWTTPAIPYVWTIDEDGNKDQGDGIVGSGVATLFVRKTTESDWHEKLLYPAGTTREDYNAPEAEKPWTVNLSFGVGGDVEVPNIDDVAKVIGITVEDMRKIIDGSQVTINGVQASDLVDYIDKQDDRHQEATLDHVHSDLGFSDGYLPGDGGSTSVKKYIDDRVSDLSTTLTGDIDDLRQYVKNAITDIVNKVYGGGTVGEDGHITWGDAGKIATGNMNVFGNEAMTSYVRTVTGTGTNSVRVR